MFSCEYFEIRKNIYFEKHLRTAASVKQFHINLHVVSFSTKIYGVHDTTHKIR